jgi:two-component system response regulator RegA
MMKLKSIEEKSKVLLIVEDFDFIRNLVGKYFQSRGYDVISVASTSDALLISKTELPSVIVVDFDMRRNDPYLIISVLHNALPDSYLILMNGIHTHCSEEKAKEAGANRTLERNFQSTILDDVIFSASIKEFVH